jgi:DNA-binding NarL/FixJ family response regulator
MTTSILLVDDHKMMRDGLRSLLEKHAELQVVGEAEDGRSAVRMVRKRHVDIVLMDVAMPDLNGIEATRQIKAQSPEVKVIALSMHTDRRFVAGILGAGASGFVHKSSAFEDVVEAITTVAGGGFYISPKIVDIVLDDYVRRLAQPEPETGPALSSREREVLQLLAEGNNSREIAGHLHISVKTVETHRHHIMAKLGLRSVANLTKYAIREGLTSVDG